MSRILIQGGRVIDPSREFDQVADLLLEDGRVAGINPAANALPDQVIDAKGKIVAPGLIDMHAHLREPGFEEDETIATGTASALVGGFASVVCMADSDPPIDTPAAVEFVQHQATRADNCNVFVTAAVSQNRKGSQLAEMGHLARAGVVAFSDAAASLNDANMMRRALEYSAMFNKPILNQGAVAELAGEGLMHEGMVSMLLGLPGIPDAAEKVMIGRDVVLCETTGGRVHVMHVSSADAVELVRRAKGRKTQVTASVCP
ncbi:MAG: amidohydrolase family protein, partial [Planctomycetales bacterium]